MELCKILVDHGANASMTSEVSLAPYKSLDYIAMQLIIMLLNTGSLGKDLGGYYLVYEKEND